MTGGCVRIATWNIRKAIGRDLRRNPGRVLRAIAALDADAVALQEADLRFAGRTAIFAPEEIERVTGLVPVRFAGAHAGLGWHGNVLLVRREAVVGDRRIHHLPSLEPRGAIEAEVTLSGLRLRIVAAHLALLAPFRLRQAARLAGRIEADRPTLVMGDFNAWRAQPASLRPISDRLRLVPTGNSFPASRPVSHLDRIYCTPTLEIAGHGIRRDGLAPTSSDHLPVWVDVS